MSLDVYFFSSQSLEQLITDVRRDEFLCATVIADQDESFYAIRGTLRLPSNDTLRKYDDGVVDTLEKNIPFAAIRRIHEGYAAHVILDMVNHDKRDMRVMLPVIDRLHTLFSSYAKKG